MFNARQCCCGKVMFSVMSFYHSVHRGVPLWPLLMMHWASSYRDPLCRALALQPLPPPPFLRALPPSWSGSLCIWPHPLYRAPWTCSFFLTSTSLYWDLLHDMFKLVHYKAHTVSKRAVGILLECILFISVSWFVPFLVYDSRVNQGSHLHVALSPKVSLTECIANRYLLWFTTMKLCESFWSKNTLILQIQST